MYMRNIFFAPGEIYHIFNRGVDKRIIFQEYADYKRFMTTVSSLCTMGTAQPSQGKPIGIEIFAYCLNPNHFHFIVRSNSKKSITMFMHQLGTSYSKYFNIKNERKGRLFEGSFKAKRVSSDAYFFWLMSYVTFNAQVHGIVKKAAHYRWCNFNELFGFTPRRITTDVKNLLGFDRRDDSYMKICLENANMMSETKSMKKFLLE